LKPDGRFLEGAASRTGSRHRLAGASNESDTCFFHNLLSINGFCFYRSIGVNKKDRTGRLIPLPENKS
jgi:hypothetical protein